MRIRRGSGSIQESHPGESIRKESDRTRLSRTSVTEEDTESSPPTKERVEGERFVGQPTHPQKER